MRCRRAAVRPRAGVELYSSDYSTVMRGVVTNFDTTPAVTPFSSVGLPAATAQIVSVGNGWHHVSVTGHCSTGSAQTVRARISLINGSTTYAGDGVSGVYAWGGQVNEGKPASYIHAGGTPVSRQLCGAGTLVVECVLPNGMMASQPILSLNDGAANDQNSLVLRVNSGANGILGVTKINGAQYASSPTAPLTPTTWSKVAIAWDEAGFSVAVDGQAVQTHTLSCAMRAFTRMALGRIPSQGIAGGYLNGLLHRVTYHRARLPAATLQQLTAP